VLRGLSAWLGSPKRGHGRADAPLGRTDFPTAAETATYLEAYATHFELWRHFRLSTKVEKIARTDGKWYLTVGETKSDNGKDGTTKQSVEVFDRVVLCMGGHSSTTTPSPIEGIEKFEGRMLTSWTAKRSDQALLSTSRSCYPH
jgi:cation diffusion facilitator CzcD-associated flavoprotein CzcO